MTEITQIPVDNIPVPELDAVLEMHLAIGNRLAELVEEKAAGKRIVWSSIIVPKEILYAMDVPVVFQEILGAWVSIMGMSGPYCQAAEVAGVSRDVCAIHRCHLGLALAEKRDPLFGGMFVEPDIVVGTNYACVSVSKSFQIVAERFGCPVHVLDAPINTWGRNLPDHAVDYYADQLQQLISFLEHQGFKMDWDKLAEEVQFTKDLNRLVDEIDRLKAAVPSPIKSFDSFVALTAPIAMPKKSRTLAFFERLRDELAERVKNGHAVVPDEKLRLMWVGIPPVCNLELLNHCEKQGAVVAKNMLEYMVGFPLDPDLLDPADPLRSIGRAMLASPVNPTYELSLDWIVERAKLYQVDGAVNVVKRTCGLVPGMQKLVKDRLWKELEVPSIVFDLDGVDQREFDEATATATLDSFVETLLAQKGA